MDRISVRGLATAIRLIREPVVVTYSYPRSHPLYGAGEECGVFVPMPVWASIIEHNDQHRSSGARTAIRIIREPWS